MKPIAILLISLSLAPASFAADTNPPAKPAYYGALREAPLTAIHPQGWMRSWLERQRDGLTGHLDETGGPFNKPFWGKMPPYSGKWWPYEQCGYWIDAMLRCGILLNDDFLKGRALERIRYVLENPDKDGFLGPQELRAERWPHAVFFRSLMAYSDLSGDPAILNALRRHYLGGDPYSYPKDRDMVNIENLLWAYQCCGTPALLTLAEKLYSTGEMQKARADFLSGKPSKIHGVSYNETAKLGAILFCSTGNKEQLAVSETAYRKIDQFHRTVDGLHISSEWLCPMSPDLVNEGHETCDVTDYIWSLGYLLMATGDVAYADKIEKAAFNALPGAVLADFKGCQYLSAPNQAIATRTSNHHKYKFGEELMMYAPQAWQWVDCCDANVSRAMPGFAARMWMRDREDGITATLYGPSTFTATVAGNPVTITEETSYPFSDTIRFTVNAPKPSSFSFGFRIPAWSQGAAISLNGKPVQETVTPGRFVTLKREFRAGDQITLALPASITLVQSPRNGITVERGPLVYAFPIATTATHNRPYQSQTDKLKAWDLTPAGPWNYALELKNGKLPEATLVAQPNTDPTQPWTAESAPFHLKVSARQLEGWTLRAATLTSKDGKTSPPFDVDVTPNLPEPGQVPAMASKETQTIELVPYGYTKLRVAIFPALELK